MNHERSPINSVLRRGTIGLGAVLGASAVIGAPIAEASPARTSATATAAHRIVATTPVAPTQACPDALCSDGGPYLAPGAECPNPNPGDGRDVYRRNITNSAGTDVGDIALQYSPSARCVRAWATCVGDSSAYVTAFVFKPSLEQVTSSNTVSCGSKAVTAWVNDAGISQLGIGRKKSWSTGAWLGYGQTPAY